MSAAPPAGLAAVVEALAADRLTPEKYLETLAATVEAREPEVRALVPEPGRFERLATEIVLLPRHWASTRPPLLGVPVGVKDVFRVDGMPTTGGSRLPTGLFEGEEAECVSRLRRAGALVLGKTVSTEFAYFAPGATTNPHDPRRTPGGSSSGSAAAVAAGYCPLALGTQTIGSVCRPASYCGVVGFKPSYGRVPTIGLIPLAPSLDHVGTFTADVAGAALAAAVLCDEWRPAEPARRPVLGLPVGSYLDRTDPEGLEHFLETTERLAAAGFEIERLTALDDIDEIETRHNRIVAAEAAAVHAQWYPKHGDLYHPKTVELVERGARVSAGALASALAGRARLRDELATRAADHFVDLWISPAATGAAPIGLESTGSPIMNLPWTHAGLPSLALPAGRGTSGMPIGLQLAAGFGEDEMLLAWAAAIEEAVRDA